MTKPGAAGGYQLLTDIPNYKHPIKSSIEFVVEMNIENTTGTSRDVTIWVAYTFGSSKTSYVFNDVNPPIGYTKTVAATTTIYFNETYTGGAAGLNSTDPLNWVVFTSQPVGAGLFKYQEIDFSIREITL